MVNRSITSRTKLNFTAIDEDTDDEKSGREIGVPNVFLTLVVGGVTEEGTATLKFSFAKWNAWATPQTYCPSLSMAPVHPNV
eukprot:3725336-Pyramimonas_sp.AAC.1